MSELALNLLLGVALINAIVTARTQADQRRARIAQFGPAMFWWMALTMLVLVGLWCWIAASSGYWQFAALPLIPLLVTIGGVASKPTPTPDGPTS